MLKSLLLTFMLCPIVMSAQTAKVQALTPAEAAEAKSLYQQKSDLDKKIADFRDSLVKEYVRTKNGKEADPTGYAYGGSDGIYYFRTGWRGDDFLFSDDFKYIVPAPAPVQSSTYCWTQNGCSYAVPAVGTIQGTNTSTTDGAVSATTNLSGTLVRTPDGVVCTAPLGTHCEPDGTIASNSGSSN